MFVLTFFHPFNSLTMVAVLWVPPLGFSLAERRIGWVDWKIAGVATAVWLPAVIHNAYVFRTNTALRSWDLQNLMYTPEPGRLAIAFGVSGALAIIALARFRRLSRPQLVAAAWVVAAIVLIHLPFRFQRRMLGGIQIPLAVLATVVVVTFAIKSVIYRAWGLTCFQALSTRDHLQIRQSLG